jgi:predicted PurR-regulated permease PerM
MIIKPELPFYLRMSQLLIGIVAFFYILYIGQGIIVPLIFSLVIAILLNPFVNFLERKLHRVIAIAISVILAAIIILGLLIFIGSQATMFSDSFPMLKQKFTELLSDGIQWVAGTFNVSTTQIQAWIANIKNEGISNSTGVIGQTLSSLSGVLIVLVLIPVYIFLFLFYKPLLLGFIAKLFPAGNYETVSEVLNETKSLIQNYLVGLMIEFILVSALDTIALLLLGIQYALLLGVIGGLLNVIPYIGGVIAIAMPMILALATKEPIYVIYVFVAYMIVQLIDNHYINPVIVASKVKINALVSIVIVLLGGALWGVAGMFLSLPLTAIAKVIFDRIDPLKPFGFLLGDTMPPIGKDIFVFLKPKKKDK